MMEQTAPPFVFLSHAHADEEYVHRLMHDLQAHGIAVWIDQRGIPVGDPDWEETIRKAIAHASAVVLVASPRARASKVVYDELAVALLHERPVYPFWIDGEHWIESIPFGWGRTQHLDARHANYENARMELITLLQKQLRSPLVPVALSPVRSGVRFAAYHYQPVWSVPYRRNRFFTGREHDLQTLHEQLTTVQQVAVTQAISGLGGVGKTQLAVEYAYRFRSMYRTVLWTRADTQETLLSDLANLATILDLPEQHEQEQIKMVQAVKRWLSRHSGWIIILDNVDDLQLVEAWIPVDHHGAVLLTTRQHETGYMAQAMELSVFADDDGMLFLLKRAKRITPHWSLDEVTASEDVIARAITQRLGGLPLALDQAGAYIAETRCSLSDYLHLLQQEQKALLARRGTASSEHPQSVTTTFSLAFEQIQQHNEAAAELLNLCAFLAPDAIPLELITQGAIHLGSVLEPVVADALHLDQALEMLQAYSLVRRDGENRTLSVHRLVQAVLKDGIDPATARLWAERAVLAVNAAFPHAEHGTWPQCERLLPHALLATQYIETDQSIGEEAGRLLHETASYLQDRARYAEAEPLYQRALLIRKQQLGPEHHDMAYPLNNLAIFYYDQGKYAEAEPLYQHALRIWEQQLGPDHPDVAISLNNLAELYGDQGRYAEAEPLYQRALHIFEQQLEPGHPLIAYPLNGLALLSYEQGKYAEAEPLYQRALRIREQALVPQSPDTAETMHGLARLRDAQGNSEDARDWYARALAIREQALGAHHPKTSETRSRFIALLQAMDRHEEAAQFEAVQTAGDE